jgi:hypothetical protein
MTLIGCVVAPRGPPTSIKVKEPKSDLPILPYKARGRTSRPSSTSPKSARPRRRLPDSDSEEVLWTPPDLEIMSQNPMPEQPKVLVSNVESLAREQAFDGSFTPKPDLYDLLTGKSFVSDQPLSVQHLLVEDTIKATLWCTILVLAYLEVNLSEEEDAWSLFADKAVSWIKDILSDANAGNDAEVWLMDARKEANKAVVGK